MDSGLFLEVYAVLQGVTKSIRQSGDCFWSSQNPWFGKNSFSSKLPSRLQWICSSSWHSCRSIQYRSIWQSPILLATTMMMWTSCFSEILRKTRKYKAGFNQPANTSYTASWKTWRGIRIRIKLSALKQNCPHTQGRLSKARLTQSSLTLSADNTYLLFNKLCNTQHVLNKELGNPGKIS